MADIEEFRRLLQEQQQRALAEAEQEARKKERSAGPGAGPAAIAATTELDPQTRAMLEGVVKGRDPKQIGYSNADLAEELLKSEQVKEGAPGLSGVQRAILQRLTLVAQMFSAVAEDITIPDGFKAGFASLRFPLIKSALADPGFFSQRAHPLRIVAGDLVQKASESRLGGKQGERQLEELLQNAARDFDLSASFVRPALVKLAPLEVDAIEQFVAQLGDEKKDRDAMRNRRARDVVGKAIQSRVLTTSLPQLVEYLVQEEWAAVLVKRLLEKGPESQAWRDGIELLDNLLEHVPGAMAGRAIPDALLQRLEKGLKEAGVEESGGLAVLRGLRKLGAWMKDRQPDEPPSEMPRMVVADAPEGDPIDSTLDEILAKQMARQKAQEPPRPPPRAERPVPPKPAPPPPPRVEPAPPPPPPRVERPAPPPPRIEPPQVPPHLRAEPPQPAPPPRVAPPPPPPPPPRAAPPPPPPRAAPPPPPPPPSPPAAEAPPAAGVPRARDAAAVAAVQAAARGPFLQVLGDLLRAGRWFRVYEHSTQKMRWVKLEAFYPAQNSIVFAEFDGASPLGVNADQFVKDLKQGLSSPTNPDNQTRALLAQLIKFDVP